MTKMIYTSTPSTTKWNSCGLTKEPMTKDTLLNKVICVSNSRTLKDQTEICDWIVIDVDTLNNNVELQLERRNITYFRRPSTNYSKEKPYKFHYLIPTVGISKNQEERKEQYKIAMRFLNVHGYDPSAGQATRIYNPCILPEEEKREALKAYKGKRLELTQMKFQFIPTKTTTTTYPQQTDEQIKELLRHIRPGGHNDRLPVGAALKSIDKKELYLWWCQTWGVWYQEKNSDQYDKFPIGNMGTITNLSRKK